MTISKMMTIVFVVKLEVVSKQVGGYWTRCARALPRRSLKLIIMTKSVSYVGKELLWQLKNKDSKLELVLGSSYEF